MSVFIYYTIVQYTLFEFFINLFIDTDYIIQLLITFEIMSTNKLILIHIDVISFPSRSKFTNAYKQRLANRLNEWDENSNVRL